jgi:hypothetical protein
MQPRTSGNGVRNLHSQSSLFAKTTFRHPLESMDPGLLAREQLV